MPLKLPELGELTDDLEEMYDKAKKAAELLDFEGFFQYKQANFLLGWMYNLFLEAEKSQQSETPPEIRPIGMVLFGDINTGKSTLVTQFAATAPKKWEKDNPTGEWGAFNIIKYEVGGPKMSMKRVMAEILAKIFGIKIWNEREIRNTHRSVFINNLVQELKQKQVKVLIIDELNNLLTSTHEEVVDIFISFKTLTNQTNTRFILVGTEEILDLLQKSDKELTKVGDKPWIEKRFVPFHLEPLGLIEFNALLTTVHTAYSMALPQWDLLIDNPKPEKIKGDKIIDPKKANMLLKLSGGWVGDLLQIIKNAGISALLEGRNNLIEADYRIALTHKYVKGEDGRPVKVPIDYGKAINGDN